MDAASGTMDRKTAESHIANLYGLEAEYVLAAVESLGIAALSDEAVIEIAARQLDKERALGVELDRIEAYQKNHPGVGWQSAKDAVKAGLR